jgi:hypothetical protein
MYLPRPPQLAMLKGLARTDRHQLIANPGLGKSGAGLLQAASLELKYGSWQGAVILAPLQAAYNWAREAPAWLPNKRISLVVGEKAKREKALKAEADIYVITYDSLPWLHAYGPKNWGSLGRQMICDESTRLRGLRASWQTSSTGKRFLRTDGGVQTNALASHAEDFSHWLNMTGTPCPNGLENWWPQMWFVDGGKRLGNNYTGFLNRWFVSPTRYSEFGKVAPRLGAEAEIASRIKDVTTVIKVEDYYDIDKPVVFDRYVELPTKVLAQYRSMRDRMVMDLAEDKQVFTLQAASKVAKLNQISSGFVYHVDDDIDPELRKCEYLHDVKAAAVDSILTETGENLIVFYQFQATLEILAKKFGKRLVTLDKGGKAQDDWNAGKIEILAVQYQRGSLALSLQHGGRNICFVEPTYRADDYEQAIERAGPLRQMQSGYKRSVNVYRVFARGTAEKRITEATIAKMSLQEKVVEMLKQD